MNGLLNQLAQEDAKVLEQGEKIDFTEGSNLFEANQAVLKYLAQYRIGPVALALLIIFAYSADKRTELWQQLRKDLRSV